ncbi:MAG: hypothetical protein WBA38_04025 [Gordonia sp. (in: high G+C Gram-positive bacteria)]|uniref:hypothetical protein n=1 Tax=Gordonia sp. (in: high G+C Gram-positive bacteria) TaxID=84139 RepID=UPI003C71E424
MTTPNVGPGSVPNVPGAQPVNLLGLGAHAARDEPGWREQIDGQFVGRANNSGIGSIFDKITQLFSNVTSIFGSLGDLFDITDAQGADLQSLRADQESLTASTGKATSFMTSSPGTTTTPTRMPFTSQTHIPKNVTNLGDGRWRLAFAGEWDITAQVEFWGGVFMPPQTFLEILLRDATGAVREGVLAKASSDRDITVTNVTTVEALEPDWTVEVRAWTGSIPVVGGSFRGIRGGYATTRLMIRNNDLEAAS